MDDGCVMFKYDDESCAQAFVGSLGDGNIMRITKCDDEQIIQRFMWNGDGPITIAARPNITSILTQSF
jgi:hypothetical protein